jgi:MoxR-like ATPase
MTATPVSDEIREALVNFRAGEDVSRTAGPVPAPLPVRSATGKRVGFPRPNGETYWAREVPGAAHDVDLVRQCRGATIAENLYLLAFGLPGVGKSALFEAAFPDLITVTCNRDTDMDALLGTWVQLPDGTYEWAYGPVALAAMEGRPVLLDEVAVAPAQVLTDLYESMDGRGTLRIKSNPKLPVIRIADGFWMGGGCNPDAPGADMSDALLSRFDVHLECTTDYDLAEEVGVPRKFVKAARNLAEKRAADRTTYAHQMRELLAAKRIAERLDTAAAVANFISVAPAANRPVVADVVSRVFGYASRGLVTGSAARAG